MKTAVTETSLIARRVNEYGFSRQEVVIVGLLAEDIDRLWTRLEITRALENRGYIWANESRISARVNDLIKKNILEVPLDEFGKPVKDKRVHISPSPSQVVHIKNDFIMDHIYAKDVDEEGINHA